MRSKPCLTSADCHKMMAACIAEAQKNKWAVTIAIVDDSGAALLLERLDSAGAISATVAAIAPQPSSRSSSNAAPLSSTMAMVTAHLFLFASATQAAIILWQSVEVRAGF